MPMTIVRIIMPITSSSTAAARVVTPSGVSSLLKSPSTLTVIPIDVAVDMAPMKRAFGSVKLSANPNATVMPAPRTKGRITPPRATIEAGPEYLRNWRRSVSSPAMNSKMIDPTCAIDHRLSDTGIAKPSVLATTGSKREPRPRICTPPNANGPMMMPTESSPMTAGTLR